MERFDALVIGAGPAGSAAAILLAQAGWSVAIVERKEFPRRKVCGEYLSATNWPLLAALGVAEPFGDLAGPPVRQTAVFVRNRSASADLPRPDSSSPNWGRALAREHLDTLLAVRAEQLGVAFHQPWRCDELRSEPDGFAVALESHEPPHSQVLAARVVIAAHGSWEIGPLATERHPAPPQPDDLLAFKAHFRQANLPAGLMPLLSFPGGYGGMVHCDGGRASLSCCIRRDHLEKLSRDPQQPAGAAVLGHILESLTVLRPVLESAELDGPWLSAGPIQPGLRRCFRGGVFVVGNAAGEAHPVVAEGISMALQSAWLLTQRLLPHRLELHQPRLRAALGRDYTAAWRRAFAPRIYAAAAVANWAQRPGLVAATLPLLHRFPGLLTWGARLSGKARVVVPTSAAAVQTQWGPT